MELITEEEIVEIIQKDHQIGKPIWYTLLMVLSTIPIFLWPFIVFLSIFLFDSPKSENSVEVNLIFYSILFSPIIFIASLLISSRIFNRNKFLSIVLLIFPLVVFCIGWLLMSYPTN